VLAVTKTIFFEEVDKLLSFLWAKQVNL